MSVLRKTIDNTTKEITQTIYGRSLVPFTGGLFAIWAFFWPVSFGHWFGSIIKAIRDINGW